MAQQTSLGDDHQVAFRAEIHDQAWAAAGGPTGPIVLPVEAFALDWQERRTPYTRATLTTPAPELAVLKWLSPLTRSLTVQVWVSYADTATDLLCTLLVRRRAVRRPEDTLTLDLASQDAELADDSVVTITGNG